MSPHNFTSQCCLDLNVYLRHSTTHHGDIIPHYDNATDPNHTDTNGPHICDDTTTTLLDPQQPLAHHSTQHDHRLAMTSHDPPPLTTAPQTHRPLTHNH